jgi:4-hydroxy-2-oxoheptanedioate aldolase
MNTIQTRCANGGLAIGTMASELYSPNLPRLFHAAGFHFCIIDCEHGPYDLPMLSSMIASSRELDIDILIRPPGLCRETILKTLDMGATGVVLPMISSPKMLREAVEMVKYAPLGQRGVSITRAHSNYRIPDLRAYHAFTNEQTLVFAQIETEEGLSNCEVIAAVPGLNGLFLGPGDLSVDLGIPGENQQPIIDKAILSITTAARATGILSGVIAGDFDLLKRCRDQGMQVFSCNSELGMILRAAAEAIPKLIG